MGFSTLPARLLLAGKRPGAISIEEPCVLGRPWLCRPLHPFVYTSAVGVASIRDLLYTDLNRITTCSWENPEDKLPAWFLRGPG